MTGSPLDVVQKPSVTEQVQLIDKLGISDETMSAI